MLAGGGHKAAAGFTIDAENIDMLQDFLEENMTYKARTPSLDIDGILPSTNLPLLDRILQPLRPFGYQNKPPCFLAPYVTHITPTKSGERHSMFQAQYQGKPLRLVRFSDASCPIRHHLENTKTAHLAGFLNISKEFSSFLVCDALPASP